MTKSSKNQRTVATEGIKLFIVSVALTTTVGFWNYFSAQDRDSAIAAEEPLAVSAPLPAGTSLDMPPLPTLIAVPDNPTGFVPDSPVLEQPVAQPTPELRSVTAPTPIVAQQGQNPVVVQARGGTSSGSSPQPATTTRSSK
ncbi:MAG: hypothetical protein JXB38_15755 [Anaerolineales bacterium]|nr:hypothetical protein [Anaerolineales bacterium]